MENPLILLFCLWIGALPPPSEKTKQPGIAGAFIGVHKDVIIVTGGANFEQGYPWNNGKRVYKNDIYICRKDKNNKPEWKSLSDVSLPQGIGYGVSVDTPEGIWCLGGLTSEGICNNIYLLSWNPEAERVEIKNQMSLPENLTVISGTNINEKIYIHGIKDSKNSFFSIDTKTKQINFLKACPGDPRESTVMVAQQKGNEITIFLLGGRTVTDKKAIIHKDMMSYNPGKNQWKKESDISVENSSPVSVMGASALAVDADKIIVFGGDDGKEFLKRHELEKNIRKSTDISLKENYKTQLTNAFINHPGFTNNILIYSTITKKWTKTEVEEKLPVCTRAVIWNEKIIIPSGEIRPGVRTEKIFELDTNLK